ncbi:VanZ family protein [Roseateles cellulosilyticus]|uniref:VanZ family protein n=1 Tax=Pelomonas cellulosilytica TaxID=2906762 RepID=A0ABS8XTY3_9BURK|nr:VanZ family protein [Pelomonas sp. P8]MCE4554673.1 VanZ family protein [Pelomonas sp. P8]
MLLLLHPLCTAPGRRPLWRALLALLLLVITWLALTPAPPKVADLGWDKANHLSAFAALTFCTVWAFWPQPRQWLWVALAMLAYGIGIEIAQSFLPPREADWHDVVADSVGIALGLLTAWPIARVRR